jgi:hypothetical protein
MKLAFIPGELFLNRIEDGSYSLILKGHEIFRTRSRRSAIAKFNEMRAEMESAFPAQDLSPQGKAEILRQSIGDSLVGHNSLGGRKKKKTTAGSTRTFGG